MRRQIANLLHNPAILRSRYTNKAKNLSSLRKIMGDEKYGDLHTKADTLNDQIRLLSKQVQILKNNVDRNYGAGESSTEMNELLVENKKLNYQKMLLDQALTEEQEKSALKMTNIQSALVSIFQAAIQDAFPKVQGVPVALTLAQNPKFGDYQCNSAMAMAKLLKTSGENLPPNKVANAIVECIPTNDIIKEVDIAGPGFINIRLKQEFITNTIDKILKDKVYPPGVGAKKRVIVDFSSPNIAKQMHVGHLRSTIIGESLSRLLEFAGHDVLRLNHVGDWGTQFGMLIAHLEDEFPNYNTVVPPIADLQAFYKASKKRFDDDESFKKRAYQRVVELQGGNNTDVTKAWILICDASRKEFQQVYDLLDVTLIERGESFYNPLMPKVIEELKSSGACQLSDDGRWVMFVPGMKVPLIMTKSDGGFTYDTSDMAALKQRLLDEKADWIVYVVDAGQTDHFNQIFGGGRVAGWYDPGLQRVDHVAFGVVLGEDKKKFKTRSGDTVKLKDLMDEGLKRSNEKLLEKGRDKELTQEEFSAAQKSVAFGCIKYADLAHNRVMDYVFSFDKMLDDKGNTAVYLLYALTRIKSIQRKSNVDSVTLSKYVQENSIKLTHEKEWKLGKILCRFSEIVVRCMNELVLHPLCEYLYELSGTLTEFYDACYVIEKNKEGEILNVDMNRIALLEAAAKVFEQGFYIVGIKPVSRM